MKKLDIAAGLAVGSYSVVLTASNGTTPYATLNFTVTVTQGKTVTLSVSFQSRTTESAANEEKLTVKWIEGGAVMETE